MFSYRMAVTSFVVSCMWHQYFSLRVKVCFCLISQFIHEVVSLSWSAFISGRLGSASSNSSCGSADYMGEVIPHHPGIESVIVIIFFLLYLYTKQCSCLTSMLFQGFPDKTLATGGLHSSLQNRASLECRMDPNIKSEHLNIWIEHQKLGTL